jgi:IS30 family transposase
LGAPKRRNWKKKSTYKVDMKKVHLTREQWFGYAHQPRYTISAMHKQGCSQTLIAQAIDKDKSVVSRERCSEPVELLKRNANTKGKYSFGYAQDMAELRKERMKKPRKRIE